ncbi:MAG: ATP-binding protein [Microscillaceae bacterium]|jgi:serine/threonine-protein kinase RsbW|nr:ATP-binding protein [Microscillaceae bacterium]
MIHHYKVSCQRDNLKLIREFVNVVLRNLSLTEIEINQLVLAVDEICANLIIHAHHCNPEESIEINILDFKEKILFEIIDHATNELDFDPNQYQAFNLKKIIKERRKGGLGLMLVNKIMDDVELKSDNSLNIWRLSKNIKPQIHNLEA